MSRPRGGSPDTSGDQEQPTDPWETIGYRSKRNFTASVMIRLDRAPAETNDRGRSLLQLPEQGLLAPRAARAAIYEDSRSHHGCWKGAPAARARRRRLTGNRISLAAMRSVSSNPFIKPFH